ncbi:SDR family oxidoreductase [Pyruvatibacter mobilis]|uniref:SDR family oxidoreductase n=1 Tax=Pyruvatibacter mobilis TaxID=1712261 RepID=UPI003C7A7914
MTTPQTILITGASRGIGLLTARHLAESGHKVIATMRDPDGRNADAASGLRAEAAAGRDITVAEMDVTSDASVNAAIAAIDKHTPIDVLVNNAGVMPTGLTEAYTEDQVRQCMDVNLMGIVRTSRAVLPGMRARGSGLLVSLSSAAGRLSIPFFGVYCASKWAMESYCESLHYELAPKGIESVLVEPSGHGTDLVSTSPAPADSDVVAAYGDRAKGRDRLLGMFQTMFDEGDAMTDAGNVARAIAGLVEMEGPRPLRTQVGHDMGVEAVNAATAPVQQALIDQLKPVYEAAE